MQRSNLALLIAVLALVLASYQTWRSATIADLESHKKVPRQVVVMEEIWDKCPRSMYDIQVRADNPFFPFSGLPDDRMNCIVTKFRPAGSNHDWFEQGIINLNPQNPATPGNDCKDGTADNRECWVNLTRVCDPSRVYQDNSFLPAPKCRDGKDAITKMGPNGCAICNVVERPYPDI